MVARHGWHGWMVFGLGIVAAIAAGCTGASGDEVDRVGLRAETALPARRGTVLIDGCVVDTWQRATLAGAGARRMLDEVILLCLVPRLDGTVGPRDPSALANLASTIASLRQDGYSVHLGVAFTDETGQRYDGAQTATLLSDVAWRNRFRETLVPALAAADGVEIDLQQLPDSARAQVTSLISDVSRTVRPGKKLGVFVPPSVADPSDLPGGEAFARDAIASQVDRMRIMTLDFSETTPGPTTDPGWAVDAVRLALRATPNVDISYPLYGTDFGPRGRRSITYFEAIAVAKLVGAPIERGPTTAPFVRWVGFGNEPHELWFDDAESTARALGAWTHDVLPPGVGVLFYGLGAEDPSLFERLGPRMP